MSTRNNLEDALKGAFENHTAPLREAQWERLEGALAKSKPRAWFYSIWGIVLLMLLSAGLTYLITINYKDLPVTGNSPDSMQESQKTTGEVAGEKTGKLSIPGSALASSAILNAGIHKSKKNDPVVKKNGSTLKQDVPVIIEKEPEVDPVNDAPGLPVEITQKENTFEVEDQVLTRTEETGDDSDIDTMAQPGRKNTKHKGHRGTVISLSAGYSNMNNRITALENSNTLHKDTRKLFDQSNSNPGTFFTNLGIDFRLFPGFNMGINSGIQYLHTSTKVNINYTMNEVPFRESDGSIIGYITDSVHARQFSVSSTNTTNFIMIPVKWYYTFPLSAKSEILLTGGANLSAVVSAGGQNFSVNEGVIKPLNRKMYSSFNVGYIGGIQYSQRIREQWWIGMEGLWQSNGMKFKTGQGAVKSNLSGYNINLVLRYKL